jgi:hypothetical protein
VGDPKGYSLSAGGQHDGALYPFTVRAGRRSMRGVLLVIPANKVDSTPVNGSFDTGNLDYASRSAFVTWEAGDLIYVCFVKNGEAAEMLARALEVVPA